MADVLAIYWDLDRPEALKASPVANGFHITDSWRDTDASTSGSKRERRSWGDVLRELRGLAGPSVAEALVVLPRDLLMVRKVEVPQAPPEELPDLVRFQALSKLSVPLENLILDFLPLPSAMATTPGMLPVLVFAISRDQMNEMTSAVSEAGLTLTQCRVSTLVCAEGAWNLSVDSRGAQLTVYQRGDTVELAVVDQGNLVFTHATHLGHDDAGHLQPLQAELTRSIVSLQQYHPNAEFSQVVLFQDPPTDGALAAFLKERYGDRLMIAGLAEVQRFFEVASEPTEVTAPLWCGLLPHRPASLPQINFLAPRNRPPVRNEAWKRWAYVGGAALVLMLAALWSWWGGLASRDREIADLTTQESDLRAVLKTGQPVLDSSNVVSDWLATQVAPTEIFAELEPLLPGTDRLYFQELKWSSGQRGTRARLFGRGNAKSRQEIESLFHRLAAAGYQVRPQVSTSVSRDAQYPETFVLDLELPLLAKTQGTTAGGKGP